MVFTSFKFLIFFSLLFSIYYSIPIKLRWKLLLISSLFFYGSIKPIFILLLIFISIVSYFSTRLFEKITSDKNKFYLFLISIVAVISPLFFFKYYNSINTFLSSIFELEKYQNGISYSWLILPIGISYYTFMSIGYIVDVYNEKIKAEKNFGIVLLFLSYFPLVLSGPIERAEKMFQQFKNKLSYNHNKVINGFQLILWGVFLKMVLADNLSLNLNPVFENLENNSGKTILFSILLYPFQIYGDLGGYSLIAIGVSSALGINVRINFKRPFLSNSMSSFWRRWHMSLISWITDYIYTPISFYMRKKGLFGIIISLLITFVIAGLWHDATISFVIWGLIQGLILSFEASTKNIRFNFQKKFGLINNFTFNLLCSVLIYFTFSFSLIFGSAFKSLSETSLAINKILFNYGTLLFDNQTLLKLALIIFIVIFIEFKQEFFSNKFKIFRNKSMYVRWSSYIIIIIIIIFFGIFNNNNFIYFQF